MNTRDKILEQAIQLSMKRGINGWSYADIAEHLGIRKASVHYHFNSKTILAKEVMRFHAESVLKKLDKINEGKHSTKEKLELFIQLFKSIAKDSELFCPGGMMLAEMNTLDEEVVAEVKRLFDGMILWVKNVLKDRYKENEAEIFARRFVATLEGVLLFSRLYCDKKLFDNIINNFLNIKGI